MILPHYKINSRDLKFYEHKPQRQNDMACEKNEKSEEYNICQQIKNICHFGRGGGCPEFDIYKLHINQI